MGRLVCVRFERQQRSWQGLVDARRVESAKINSWHSHLQAARWAHLPEATARAHDYR